MSDLPEDHFMRKRIVIVRCAEWFSKCNKTDAGMKAIDWYIGTVELDDTIAIHHGIDTAKLAAERQMVKEHNERIDLHGDASTSAVNAAAMTIEQGRKQAMLQRGGPSALFRGNAG